MHTSVRPSGLRRPRTLRPGDTIALVAPSGPFERDAMMQGVAIIETHGYRCALPTGQSPAFRYLAAPDAQRVASLASAVLDERSAAVWCIRGGYGATRLLSRLAIADWPEKAIVGFSDVTALHAALQANGRASIHGPGVMQLGREPAHSVERVFALLEGRPAATISGGRKAVGGRATGRLLGGNLVLLSHLVGTPYFPDPRGAILLLEEVAERPYRLDRMWTQLRLAGVLDKLAGVAVGQLVDCEEAGADYRAAEVMADLLGELGVPSAMGFPIGHGAENQAVMLGGLATLDADAGTLEA